MKQLCENCGRRFDAELTDGICPYCGRYLNVPFVEEQPAPQQEVPAEQKAPERKPKREEPEKQEEKAKPRGKQETKKAYEAYKKQTATEKERRQAQKRREEQKKQEENKAKDVRAWVACGVLLLILLSVLSVITTGTGKKQETQSESTGKNRVAAAQEVKYELGEAMKIGPEEREVLFSKPEAVADMRGLDAKNKMVRVYCQVDKLREYSSNYEIECYLEVDNQYYCRVDSYKMERYDPEMAKEMAEDYAICSSSMDAGWMYFVVPADTQAGTVWVSYPTLTEESDQVISSVVMHGVDLSFEEGEVQE